MLDAYIREELRTVCCFWSSGRVVFKTSFYSTYLEIIKPKFSRWHTALLQSEYFRSVEVVFHGSKKHVLPVLSLYTVIVSDTSFEIFIKTTDAYYFIVFTTAVVVVGPMVWTPSENSHNMQDEYG